MEQFEWFLKLNYAHIVDFQDYDEEKGKVVFDKLEDFLFGRTKDVTKGKKIIYFFALPDMESEGVTNIYVGYDSEFIKSPGKLTEQIYGIMEKMEII